MKHTVENINNQLQEIENRMNNPDLCKGTADTYSRISGYYRSIANWNNGKKSEFHSRLAYVI
jgi:anaerobic ribonucleoside-triphosphate reductase